MLFYDSFRFHGYVKILFKGLVYSVPCLMVDIPCFRFLLSFLFNSNIFAPELFFSRQDGTELEVTSPIAGTGTRLHILAARDNSGKIRMGRDYSVL